MKEKISEYERHEITLTTKQVIGALNEKYGLSIPRDVFKIFHFRETVDLYWYEDKQ